MPLRWGATPDVIRPWKWADPAVLLPPDGERTASKRATVSALRVCLRPQS